jgi:hypothetical protein
MCTPPGHKAGLLANTLCMAGPYYYMVCATWAGTPRVANNINCYIKIKYNRTLKIHIDAEFDGEQLRYCSPTPGFDVIDVKMTSNMRGRMGTYV